MADLTSQIDQARKAGYSDDDIVSYLGKAHADLAPKIKTAVDAGYDAASIVKHLSTAAAPQQDVLEKALNYKTGSVIADTQLGLVQGAAKGLIQTGYKGAELLRKIPGVAEADAKLRGLYGGTVATPDQASKYTEANGAAQGLGKFTEQSAEFAVPSAAVGKVVKGAPVVARALAQGAVGGSVAAAQNGGDPASTLTGAALGAGGELAGAAIQGAKSLVGNKAPTLANYAESFGNATPTQKARLSKALGTLQKDGIAPGADIHEMADTVKGQLGKLGQAYQQLPADIATRSEDALNVMQKLQNQQDKFVSSNGHILSENRAAYDMIGRQINDVASVADQNNGKITFAALKDLRDAANGKTNFNSPDAEKSLFKGVGDTYRDFMDKVAPETTPLNRDYARYKDLEQIVDQNISRGKGTTPSGLDALLKKATAHGVGASAGAALGHSIAGPVGGAVGAIAGGIIGPKLGKSAAQALQNAVDAGAFQALSPAKQASLRLASRVGDNAAVLKLLSQSATQELSTSGGR